jgi:type IV fimbrial biogenesis protein FimT
MLAVRKTRRHRGFTLIELMVAVGIATILMMVAVPSFETFRRNSELTSATNTLLSSINAARGEAMKRGMSAMVVPADGVNWTSGWTVFVDIDRSRAFTPGVDFIVLQQAPTPIYINVAGNGTAAAGTPYIMFDPSGYSVTTAAAPSNLTLNLIRNDVAVASQFAETRRIVIATTGRTRSCKPANAIDPTCGGAAVQ